MNVTFITGIDTDIGKTYTTGLLAKALYEHGCRVITQKLVQTGCHDIADDIVAHRKIMGVPLQEVDEDSTTCPYIFSKPASPHLASALESRVINPQEITAATHNLAQQYDCVLLEGAGGLMVPIRDDLLTIDYIARQRYPVILVTSGRLGSINHTLMSIEMLKHRSLHLHAIIYNHWQRDKEVQDQQIAASTKSHLKQYLQRYYLHTHWIDLPNINDSEFTDTEAALTSNSFSQYVKQLMTGC